MGSKVILGNLKEFEVNEERDKLTGENFGEMIFSKEIGSFRGFFMVHFKEKVIETEG